MYMAPEIIKRYSYDNKVDIWSAGIVIFIMLSGRPPFGGSTKEAIYKTIKTRPLEFPDREWAMVSSEAKDFIERCLNKDPVQRATAAQLLAHPWMQNQGARNVKLEHVSQNLINFCVLSNFQKIIISVLTGLKI